METIMSCRKKGCPYEEKKEFICPICGSKNLTFIREKSLKPNLKEILEEMDNLSKLYLFCRSRFPYIDEKEKESLTNTQTMAKIDIEMNNEAAHLINKNFFINLYAILDYYVITKNPDKNIDFYEDIDLLKEYRIKFAHTTGKFNGSIEHIRMRDKFLDRYLPGAEKTGNFIIPSGACMKLFCNCRLYVEELYKKKSKNSL